MKKPAAVRKRNSRSRKSNRDQIETTLLELAGLKPRSSKAAEVISLLEEWLNDQTGYDENTWPALKESLNRERRGIGARRLFSD